MLTLVDTLRRLALAVLAEDSVSIASALVVPASHSFPTSRTIAAARLSTTRIHRGFVRGVEREGARPSDGKKRSDAKCAKYDAHGESNLRQTGTVRGCLC